MAKTIDTDIQESEATLLYLLRQQGKLLQQSRVKALLLIKQGKVKYTYQLADKLKRERKTIYNWLKLYKDKGINGYLNVSSRGKRKEKLSPNEKQAIALKLQDPATDITSYVELLHWVSQQFEKDIPYHVVYNYCRTHLKSRLKIARKSHHKKDGQAVEAFKKTASTVKVI
jgi:transposase